MYKFTIALLCASSTAADYVYNYDKSVSSISKLRNLSKKLVDTENYDYGA